MKTLRTLPLALCVLAIASVHTVSAGNGPFSLNRICQDSCIDDTCTDDCCVEDDCQGASGWLSRICNFSSDDDCCIDDGCLDDGCVDYGADGKLFGFIRPTSDTFSDFVSPMSNPLFFEDPRNLTEIHFIYLNQRIPRGAFAGTLNVFAAQIRASLTDRLSIVASNDGFVTSSNPLVLDGWADVSAGLKYNIIQDAHEGKLLSAGFAYIMPSGSTRTLQAQGDGDFHLYLSAGKRIGCKAHYLTSTGFRLPANAALGSKMFYWSNHLDYQVSKKFYLLGEVNWFNWFQGGNSAAVPNIEGGDLINIGSNDVAGNNIVTAAMGVKMRVSGLSEMGLAYEIPLSSRRDFMDNRLTLDYNWRF